MNSSSPSDFGWRRRLSLVVEASGRSKRSISLAAGLGPNYLREILAGKSPTLDYMILLCKELGIRLADITDIDP